jgi:hypothetical protein
VFIGSENLIVPCCFRNDRMLAKSFILSLHTRNFRSSWLSPFLSNVRELASVQLADY